MKKSKANSMLFIFIVCIMFTSIKIKAASDNNITTRDYIIRLVKICNIKVEGSSVTDYINAAIKTGILLEEEKKQLSKKVTRTDAAVYAERADEILNGKNYNEALYEQVISKKRISDWNKIEKEKRSSVAHIFSKGIIVGESNGLYSQSRKWNGEMYLTKSAAKIIINRIQDKSKRKLLSFDGQLIRLVNLPKNYKSYSYILESFPNEFYETQLNYERAKKGDGSPMKEYEDYVQPVHMRKTMFNEKKGYTMSEVMDSYLDIWCKRVEINLKCRFHVDYRTIDKKWISDLRSSYYIWNFGEADDAEKNKKTTDKIKEYVKFVKKHKIVIQADKVVVEPSTLYEGPRMYIRAYVKFKVVSFEGKLTQNELFFCDADYAYIPGVKKGKTIETILDMDLGSINGYSTGEDYAILMDYLDGKVY